MRVIRSTVAPVCAVCERTLLQGEHAVRFSPDGHGFVDVCPLCHDVALDSGWVREGIAVSPTFTPTPRRRRQKTLWQALLGAREEEPEPVVTEPILRRLSDDEIALVEAAELFNQSQFRRTVAGVARSLGDPTVSIVPLSGVNAETVITVVWDLTWYQYRVSPESGQPVRIAERGQDPGEIEPEFTAWNALLEDDGRLVPDLVRVRRTEGAPDEHGQPGFPCLRAARTARRRPCVRRGRRPGRADTHHRRGARARDPVGCNTTDAAVARAVAAFASWRDVPAPQRGELVRVLGEELRREKEPLGALVTLEVGKITQEGLGEVQEMIDICDFAVGLSRQLYGRSIASERPGHRLTETWHPLGPVAVISAFNFPVAVWSWNAALALVCGDPVIWKPSERTPLSALACTALLRRAAERVGGVPDGLFELVVGGADRAMQLADDTRVPLVSATGSTQMGKALAPRIAGRLGRSLLELGGNNAAIVAPSADLELVVRGVLFSAVGTAGQRCTSLRRLIVHETIADELVDRLASAYASIPVGDPREPGTLVGPLITGESLGRMEASLEQARSEGGQVVVGGERVLADRWPDAWYATPALVRMPSQTAVMHAETFAPILYVLTYRDFDEAVALQNGVPQGLASSVFTTDLREAERFLSAAGSDCGISNVNIGPSGAEIGGAFGGEKETGGGRESGSDAWKAYMRRQTATVNFTSELPLAQGIVFDVP